MEGRLLGANTKHAMLLIQSKVIRVREINGRNTSSLTVNHQQFMGMFFPGEWPSRELEHPKNGV